MKQHKRPLNVAVDVEQPSTIELTLGETVRLDRVRQTTRGTVAEQYGDLLAAGTRTIALEPGRFIFKTMSDAQLRVVQGGVQARTYKDEKGDGPPQGPRIDEPSAPLQRGDAPPGKTPTFTIIH